MVFNWYFPKRYRKATFKWFEPHHMYWGWIISWMGFTLLFNPVPAYHYCGVALIALGAWISLDDAIQHTIQWYLRHKGKDYTRVSFWHWFPYVVKRWIWKLI